MPQYRSGASAAGVGSAEAGPPAAFGGGQRHPTCLGTAGIDFPPLQEHDMNRRIRKKRVRQVLLAELAAAFGEAERVALLLEGENRAR